MGDVIKSNMKRFALLGDPVEKSLSPFIYNTLFKSYALDASFECVRVPKSDVSAVRDIVSDLELSGFACTMPLKRTVLPLLDEVDADAMLSGSVNVVRVNNGRLSGCSTDGLGLVNALKNETGDICGKSIAILGSGGACASAALAAARAGMRVTIAARNTASASEIASTLPVDSLCGIRGLDELADALGECDIFVNATPLGMSGNDELEINGALSNMKRGSIVFDMVYKKGGTRLLNDASSLGIKALSGIYMLLEQAYPAFELWTGRRVEPREKDLLKRALYNKMN